MIQVQVTGGNRPALKALLGAAQPTTFTTDRKTRWIAVNGNTPLLSASDTVLAGDLVRVVVRAPRHTPLATLVATPAASVTDLSAQDAPARPPVPVRRDRFGDRHERADDHGRRELRQLARSLRPARPAGAPDLQVRRRARCSSSGAAACRSASIPSVIHAGDPLTLRVFGPTWNTPLATLLTTPLWRVKVGEPMRLALRDGAELPAT